MTQTHKHTLKAWACYILNYNSAKILLLLNCILTLVQTHLRVDSSTVTKPWKVELQHLAKTSIIDTFSVNFRICVFFLHPSDSKKICTKAQCVIWTKELLLSIYTVRSLNSLFFCRFGILLSFHSPSLSVSASQLGLKYRRALVSQHSWCCRRSGIGQSQKLCRDIVLPVKHTQATGTTEQEGKHQYPDME